LTNYFALANISGMSSESPEHTADDFHSEDPTSPVYQRSTVRFPYSPLRDAEMIAQELHDKWGGTATLDQLAGGMGTGPRGGTFRVKVATARTFGATTTVKGGVISLTDLGRKLLDPQTRAAARVDAFLTVPLFSQLVEEYKGSRLPPTSGLEQKIAALGVSAKQVSKARVAFQRSAEQAGFFKHGKDRLIPPPRLPESSETPAGANPRGSRPDAGRGIRGPLSGPTLPAPLPELWLTLLRDGRSWSAEKTQEFVETARKLHELLKKESDS
jgi:hypothetical protein